MRSEGWAGAPGWNTYYFTAGHDTQPAAPITNTEAQLAHDRVRNAFAGGLSLFPSIWTATVDPTVDVIEDTTGALVGQFGVTGSAPLVGTNLGGFGPTAAMYLLQLRTQRVSSGKILQGRSFLGPCVGIGGVPPLTVWRRPRDADATAVPPVTARLGDHGEVTAITCPDKFAVMRSRRD